MYIDVKADYRTSSLYPADIQNILTGLKITRTPIVLGATENDKTLFSQSGNNKTNALIYNALEFKLQEARSMLETISQQKKILKSVFVMGTYFSGLVTDSCKGIKGVLMLTAANDSELQKLISMKVNWACT